MKESEVLDKQIASFDVWLPFRNLFSYLKYTESSHLRLLFHEFNSTGLNRKGERVLDFGFGNGHALFWFKPGSEIYGAEISDKAIQTAKKRAMKKNYRVYNFVKPLSNDSVRLPFPDDFFTVVISSHTIEHAYDDEELLHEFFRVCRPEGKAFFIVPIDIYDENLLLEKNQRLNPKFPENSFHVSSYNLNTFRYIVEKMGFTIIRSYKTDALMDMKETRFRTIKPMGPIFSILPYTFWSLLDRYTHRRGFHHKQAVVIATK
ncbi:MAG: methyltransferase domain-containing protein [Candidatus Hodarchaeota archaeon]